MKEYLDEEEYLEDIYGDEIKVGDGFYRIKLGFETEPYLIHEKNIIEFAEFELCIKKEER